MRVSQISDMRDTLDRSQLRPRQITVESHPNQGQSDSLLNLTCRAAEQKQAVEVRLALKVSAVVTVLAETSLERGDARIPLFDRIPLTFCSSVDVSRRAISARTV